MGKECYQYCVYGGDEGEGVPYPEMDSLSSLQSFSSILSFLTSSLPHSLSMMAPRCFVSSFRCGSAA